MNKEESLLAAIYENVSLRPYDASWPDLFEAERQRLQTLFPGRFIDIQHIGSTAVPGLSAKPVVDILAGVESMSVVEELIGPLCQSSYATSAEFNDKLPDSRWFMRWADGHRTHHLHVAVHGSEFWTDRLRFRDALRASPVLAAEYRELKASLAELHREDREAYTEAKRKFILTSSQRNAR